MQELTRRMVDVDQDGVVAPPRPVGIEAGRAGGEDEEIALDQPQAGICGQLGTQRQQALPVPVDHGCQRIDDQH